MREILFRGKRTDNGEWVYGDLLQMRIDEDKTNFFIIEDSELDSADCENTDLVPIIWNKVIPSTIGQFTGLTDKNGTKIFENDVIKWDAKEWGSEFTEVVEWDYELFSTRKSDWKEWCEVIGNIHESEVGE